MHQKAVLLFGIIGVILTLILGAFSIISWQITTVFVAVFIGLSSLILTYEKLQTEATKLKEERKPSKDISELWNPLPKIRFSVAQQILRKLQFPQVGWEAYNDSPYQLKVRIEVHPILGGRDLHPLPDNDINGNKVYPVEPYSALFGNGCFTLPEVCATRKNDELILEIRAIVKDVNDSEKGEYKLFPSCWKYVREHDAWSYYPQTND